MTQWCMHTREGTEDILEEIQQLPGGLTRQDCSWLVIAQPCHAICGLPPDAACTQAIMNTQVLKSISHTQQSILSS